MPKSEDLAQRAKFIYEKADSEGRGLYKRSRPRSTSWSR